MKSINPGILGLIIVLSFAGLIIAYGLLRSSREVQSLRNRGIETEARITKLYSKEVKRFTRN